MGFGFSKHAGKLSAVVGLSLILVVMSCFADSPSAKKHTANISSDNCTVCFTPGGDCRSLILERINSAKRSIDLAIYTITNRELANALLSAHKRGVKVRIISDNSTAQSRDSKAQFLYDSGVGVRYDGFGLMHHKFAVFDGTSFLTGSYNWSNSAESRNNENIIIIDDTELARIFSEEFERMWRKFQP